MPCGTGKTLITYLISLNYKNIILLSPLISTTEQLITHYKNYYSTCKEPINYTIINSQNTRDINIIDLSQNKNIIGSTFHSCDVINKLLEKLEGSTFIIIDECHNLSHANITDTHNEINKLLVSNYKILFVSATPKKYSHENHHLTIFGTLKYTLDWKYAIENKYICDYNFYYPNNNKIIEHINNIKFDTSIIEKTILINKAFFLLESIKTINIKKCIVYLKTIKESELFENILKTINIYFELILGIYNINYNTSRTKRNLLLTKFRNNKTKISIMLNVHILDEGIDIPECDSVYLTHPNNNPVNIIQRISRANRIAINKNNSHILLWTKNKTNLDNIIKQIKEYIPINFSNINSTFINNHDNDNIVNDNIDDKFNNLINNNKLINNLILFLQKNYNTDIIILIDNNNKLWFSYSNILKSIGYKNVKLQKKRINIEDTFFDTYKNIYNKTKTKLNTKKTNIQPATKMINESGIYLLLSNSNKKIAKKLMEYLFIDILPSLKNIDI